MKKAIVAGMLGLFVGLANAVITVDGVGTTRDQAINNAVLSASEQGSGVMVVSDQTLNNGVMTRDRIQQHTAGIVNSYKVDSCTDSNGLHNCKITATVSPTPLRQPLSDGASNSVKFPGSNSAAQINTYNQNTRSGSNLVIQTLQEWRNNVSPVILDTQAQPLRGGYPVMRVTYNLKTSFGYFKQLQAILERVSETNYNHVKDSRFQPSLSGVNYVMINSDQIGWLPKIYRTYDPILSTELFQVAPKLSTIQVQVNLLDGQGSVIGSGCDTYKSDYVQFGTVNQLQITGQGYAIIIGDSYIKPRNISFQIPVQDLSKVAEVKLTVGCSSRSTFNIT